MRELLDLDRNRTEVQLGREEVGHFEEEEARKCGSDQAVVYGVAQGRPTCISLRKGIRESAQKQTDSLGSQET